MPTTALPVSSTTTQTVALGQDTSVGRPIVSIVIGDPQPDPVNWTALPVELTATQAPAVAHETATSESAPATVVGADHDVPLKVTILPLPSTPTQKVVDRQDSETGAPPAESPTGTGWLQLAPLNTVLIPGPVLPFGPVARQNVGDTHETCVRL